MKSYGYKLKHETFLLVTLILLNYIYTGKSHCCKHLLFSIVNDIYVYSYNSLSFTKFISPLYSLHMTLYTTIQGICHMIIIGRPPNHTAGIRPCGCWSYNNWF